MCTQREAGARRVSRTSASAPSSSQVGASILAFRRSVACTSSCSVRETTRRSAPASEAQQINAQQDQRSSPRSAPVSTYSESTARAFIFVRAEALQKLRMSRMSEANPRQSLVKGERLIRYELASAILQGRESVLETGALQAQGRGRVTLRTVLAGMAPLATVSRQCGRLEVCTHSENRRNSI